VLLLNAPFAPISSKPVSGEFSLLPTSRRPRHESQPGHGLPLWPDTSGEIPCGAFAGVAAERCRQGSHHGGEFQVSIARLKGTIELGKYKLDLDEVRFSDVRPGPGPAPGNVGYDVLRHFVVTLDSKNRRIRLDQ
jgi:hypothetical protein